jgi:hypothetical protein
MKRFFNRIFNPNHSRLNILPVLVLAACIFSFPSTSVCNANAAAPPSILVIVPNAPDDLEIYLLPDNIKAGRTGKAYESYFTFYLPDLRSSEHTLKIVSAKTSFETTITIVPRSYSNTYVLNLNRQTLTKGIPVSRAINLVTLRIVLTLAIEAAVFFAFGYREKKSWIVFIVVNLVTQGILNVNLANVSNPLDSYVIFYLIFGEALVFLVETAVFLILITESRRWITFLYVMSANLLSLIVGGLLISILPV